MPALHNEKHETYAQERFKGASTFRAAEKAGYTRHAVQGLQKRADIKARIEELRGAPMGLGSLLIMWREALERAIARRDLTAENRCLRQITILSNFPVRDEGRHEQKDANKRTKERKAQRMRDAPDPALKEPEDDGDTDDQSAPDVQALDRLLGRLDNDTRDAAKAEEVGHANAAPTQDTRGDYRHE